MIIITVRRILGNFSSWALWAIALKLSTLWGFLAEWWRSLYDDSDKAPTNKICSHLTVTLFHSGRVGSGVCPSSSGRHVFTRVPCGGVQLEMQQGFIICARLGIKSLSHDRHELSYGVCQMTYITIWTHQIWGFSVDKLTRPRTSYICYCHMTYVIMDSSHLFLNGTQKNQCCYCHMTYVTLWTSQYEMPDYIYI